MGRSESSKNNLSSEAKRSAEAEQALSLSKKGENWLQPVVEHSLEITKVVDKDGILRYASPAFGRILGYDPEEVVGTMNVFDHVHPEDLPRVMEETEKTLSVEGVGTSVVEYRFCHKDGSWRCMEGVGTYLPDEPAVRGIVVTCRDVTERKKAEEALKESETFVRRLLRNLPNGSVNVFDGDLRYLFAEGSGLEEVGLSPEVLVGRTIREVFGEEGLGLVEGHYRRAFSGEEVGFELPIGKEVYEINASPLEKKEDGEVRTIITIVQNITERKRAEEALKESEERFRTAFEDSPVGVALVDIDGQRFRVNRALCEMLGCSEEKLLGGNYLEYVHPDDRQTSTEHFQRPLKQGTERYELERRYLRDDGDVAWHLTSVSLVQDPKGNPSYFICLHQNITKRKEAEERLRRSEVSLAAAQERAHLGSWEWDLSTDELRWSDEHYRIFGRTPQSFTPIYKSPQPPR